MNVQGLGESAKYLNQVPATPMTNLFVFSTDWLANLPADYQTLILETAKTVTDTLETEYVAGQYNGCLAALQEAGVEIVEPSESLLAELKEASKSVVDNYCGTSAKHQEIYDALTTLISK